MLMPTPCPACGKVFDLFDGGEGFGKYDSRTVCKDCQAEQADYDQVKIELKECEGALVEVEISLHELEEIRRNLKRKIDRLTRTLSTNN